MIARRGVKILSVFWIIVLGFWYHSSRNTEQEVQTLDDKIGDSPVLELLVDDAYEDLGSLYYDAELDNLMYIGENHITSSISYPANTIGQENIRDDLMHMIIELPEDMLELLSIDVKYTKESP